MKLTIKKKLLLSFGAVLLVVSLFSIGIFMKIKMIHSLDRRLTEINFPTVMAGMAITEGLHRSLAGLRGYLILGKNPASGAKFKAERLHGWQKIDAALAKLDQYSSQWHDSKSQDLLRRLKLNIEDFRIAQGKVEDIAHTPVNIPSFAMLLNDAAPRAGEIIAAITRIIDAEAIQNATPDRKRLLKILADSRGSFAMGLANIRAYLLSGDVGFIDKFRKFWQTNETRYQQIQNMTHLFTPKQSKDWKIYRQQRQKFSPLPEKMFKLRKGKDWNLANYWLAVNAAPKAEAINKILVELQDILKIQTTRDQKDLDNAISAIKTILLIGMAIALAIGSFVSIYISNSITVALQAVVGRARAIANGNLSGSPLSVSSNDELADLSLSINEMNNKLGKLIRRVNINAQTLTEHAEELANVVVNYSESTQKQNRQTEHVATAMTEMAATVNEVAKNATHAATAADEADKQAREGQTVVSQAVDSIHSLADDITLSSEVISQLDNDVGDISSILDVIRNVSEQTNLLALNAAIEAARAGEHGRGFAVVADEVRTLASRTQSSTDEIQAMIEKLQSGAKQAVSTIKTSHKKAGVSVQEAQASGSMLESITQSVATINDMNSQIATAAEQQSTVAEEINQSIVSISSIAEENVGVADKTRTATQNLTKLASELKASVSQFKL